MEERDKLHLQTSISPVVSPHLTQTGLGFDVDLFGKYHRLKRSILLKKKAIDYDDITKRIESTKDKATILKLVSEQRGMNYNPLQSTEENLLLSVEDIENEGKEFLSSLIDKEKELLLNQEEDLAIECENYRMTILKLSQSIGINLDKEFPLPIPPPTIPSPSPTTPSRNVVVPTLSSLPSFTFKSNPITLNEEKCRKHDGIYFGSFSLGSLNQNVTIKVNRSGRDVSHEYETLCWLNQSQSLGAASENKYLHALGLESITANSNSNTNTIEYLVLEDFGNDLSVVMRRDNLDLRKKIFVPMLLKTVSELHKMGMMHGDLKPQNILIKDNGNGGGGYQMKLCDFDCSRLIGHPVARDITTGEIKFSVSWVSPEVLEAYDKGNDLLSSLEIDLFSLGLLIEVLCRSECHPSSTALPSSHSDPRQQKLRRLLYNQESLYGEMESVRGPSSYSQTSIVRQLLSLNPSKRGTAESMLALYLSTQGTNGLQSHSDQSRRIVELNKLICDLQSNPQSLTRSELEGSLGDLMSYLASTLNLHQSEMIDKIVKTFEGGGGVDQSQSQEKNELIQKLKGVSEK